MPDTVIVGLLSLVGSLAGTFGGIYTSNKLLSYRVEKLEQIVHENDKVSARVYELEKHNSIQDTRLHVLEEEQDRIIEDIRLIKSKG